MIASSPKVKDKSVSTYLRQVRSVFNNYIQTLEVPVSKSGIATNYAHGYHPTRQLTVGNSVYFGFIIPYSCAEIKEVTIRFIPTTTGTINYSVGIFYGGIGDDESLNTSSLSASAVAVTDDQNSEIEITSLFDSVDADDQVGVQLSLTGATTTTDIQVMSLYVKYI